MSIRAIDKVWQTSQQSGIQLLALIALADYAHDDGTNAFPSTQTLREKLRYKTDRAVQKALLPLIEAGELVRHDQRGPRGVNLYDIVYQDGSNYETVKQRCLEYGTGVPIPPVQMDGGEQMDGGSNRTPPPEQLDGGATPVQLDGESMNPSNNRHLKNSSSSTHAHESAQTHERTPAHETQSVPESKPTPEHPPPAHLNPEYTDPKSEYRATPPSRGESPAFDAVVDLWKGDNLGVISRTIERELWESMLDIEIHLSKHGVSGVGESAQAWLEYALKETAKQSKASWRYTETILANIKQAGSLARHIHNYEQGVSNGSGTTATRKSKTAGTPGEGRANGATAYLDRNREHIERFRQAKVR